MGNRGIYGNRQWFWATGQTALGTADALHPIGVLDEDDTISINAIPTFTESPTFTLGDGESVTITATDASGGAVAPFVYTSVVPIAGSTGGRALFTVQTDAAVGGWINAVKGHMEFTDTTGRTTGLASAVCAELTMPNATLTSGAYYPVEVEYIAGGTSTASSGGMTGGDVGFLYMRASGDDDGDFDDNGFFFRATGIKPEAGHVLSANSQTLRCGAGSYGSETTRYIVLSGTEDCLSLDSCATAIILGDSVSAVGVEIGNVPIGVHLDGDFTDAIKIAGSNTIVDGLDIGVCSTNAINIAAQTAAGITMDTCGTYGINLSGDCTTGINISAQGTMGIALAVAAAVGGIAIDAGTVNHAADGSIVDINVDVEGQYSVNAINVNLDFETTGMAGTDSSAAFKADINELLVHTDDAGLYGTDVTLTGFDTGRCDLVGHLVTLDGDKTAGDTSTGFKVVSTQVINHSGEKLYGNWVDFSGITHTDGGIYGQYINLSYTNTAADCWGTFYLLGNYGTAISIDAGTTAIDTASDLIYVDLGVNSCSVNVMNVHIDVDTALTTGENVRGLSIDINGHGSDAADSTMSAIYLTSANTTTGVNTAVEIDGTWDTGIDLSGGTVTVDIKLQNSATITNGSADVLTITEPTITLVGSTAVTATTGTLNVQPASDGNAVINLKSDANAHLTITQTNGAGVTFLSTSDGTAGFLFDGGIVTLDKGATLDNTTAADVLTVEEATLTMDAGTLFSVESGDIRLGFDDGAYMKVAVTDATGVTAVTFAGSGPTYTLTAATMTFAGATKINLDGPVDVSGDMVFDTAGTTLIDFNADATTGLNVATGCTPTDVIKIQSTTCTRGLFVTGSCLDVFKIEGTTSTRRCMLYKQDFAAAHGDAGGDNSNWGIYLHMTHGVDDATAHFIGYASYLCNDTGDVFQALSLEASQLITSGVNRLAGLHFEFNVQAASSASGAAWGDTGMRYVGALIRQNPSNTQEGEAAIAIDDDWDAGIWFDPSELTDVFKFQSASGAVTAVTGAVGNTTHKIAVDVAGTTRYLAVYDDVAAS